MRVELWRESHFDVADALVDTVPSQFVCGALQGFCVLQHSRRVGKTCEIFHEASVAFFEHQLFKTRVGVGREFDFSLLRHLDQGIESQRPIQVYMKVGFWEFAKKLVSDHAGYANMTLARCSRVRYLFESAWTRAAPVTVLGIQKVGGRG